MVKKSYMARSISEALEIIKDPSIIPYAGGTDIMVTPNKDAAYVFVNKIPKLKKIEVKDEHLSFGAACTFTELLESDLTPAILKEAALNIAAPAIRNAGTIGGNIANGSPKADSALIFMVTDSKLVLQSTESQRTVSIKDFYKGNKKLDIRSDELITEVLMPNLNYSNYYYTKVAARGALAISRLSFAAIIDVQNDMVTNFATAFGALSDVIIRPVAADAQFIGKSLMQAKDHIPTYIEEMDKEIVPIRGRVSAEYRKTVAMNLLRDFLSTKLG